MHAGATCFHLNGGLRKAQLLPGGALPLDRPVVPFHEHGGHGGDVFLLVAAAVAVADADVGASALLMLPGDQLGINPHQLPGTDLLLPRVVLVREEPEPSGSRILAQQLQEAQGGGGVDSGRY